MQLNYPCAPAAGPEILERRTCGPQCRGYHGRMDHLAGEIEKLVRCMPGLTGMDLVRMLHERARSRTRSFPSAVAWLPRGALNGEDKAAGRSPSPTTRDGRRLAKRPSRVLRHL
jgi:hypothetical protein